MYKCIYIHFFVWTMNAVISRFVAAFIAAIIKVQQPASGLKFFKTRFFHFCVYHWLECDITHETGLPPALMTCSPFSDAAKQRHTSSRSGCIRMDLWLSVEGSMSHLQGLSNGIFFFCSRFPRIWMKKCAEKQFWASWIGFCIRTYLKKKFLTFLGGLFNYQPLHSNF